MKRCAIIGGGISGLSAAYQLQRTCPDLQIELFEAEPRLGGVIRSENVAGFVLDGGPDSFLTQKAAGVELCRELGLGSALVGSNDSTRKTFILHQGELKPFPEGFFLMVPTRLSTLVSTPLISWPGKMAALKDLFMLPETRDCSVADFVGERFGLEILQNIAEPLISGVYGADVKRLSLRTALPQIWELQKKGSLILNLLRKPAPSSGSAPSLFTTLRDGMESLIQALQERCRNVRWRLSEPVSRLQKTNGMWNVNEDAYDAVILAASRLPEIQTACGEKIVALLRSIHRNSAVVVSLGFERLDREGFGWLVPSSERHSVLACTYVHNKFAQRSPHGRGLVRLFIGGKQALEWIDRSDDDILTEVRNELKRIAKIDHAPLFSRIYRWRNAMPEYVVGHDDKIAEVDELSKQEGNLFLTGNVFAGVGIPDCIRHAKQAADRAASACAL